MKMNAILWCLGIGLWVMGGDGNASMEEEDNRAQAGKKHLKGPEKSPMKRRKTHSEGALGVGGERSRRVHGMAGSPRRDGSALAAEKKKRR